MSIISKDIGIDLGTSNIRLHVKGKGIVVEEPSVVAINKITGEILAVGNQAKEMIGRTPNNIVALKPLKDGVIADFEATRMLIQSLISRVVQKSLFSKPRVVVSIPSGITDVEERAAEGVAYKAGAKDVFLMEEVMASAIGAGIKVEKAEGAMIVDIGGGTSEMAVLSLGGIVVSNSIKIAGDKLDNDIVEFIKKKFNVAIGETTAEEIKMSIGSAYPSMTTEEMDVKGRDFSTGLPRTITVTSIQIEEAMKEVIMQIVDGIKMTLEKTPPELAADIMINGITLSGGGALIKNFDRLLALETGIPVNIAETPLDCVVKGAGKVLEDLDNLKGVFINAKRKR